MKPKTADNHPDLYRAQLSQILNMSHPLCRLAKEINGSRIEDNIDVVYSIGCGQPAIEPIIGHLKSDHRLNRNHLKGKAGDRANVVLAAAAYNMAKLLAWFYWLRYFQAIFRRLSLKIAGNQKINFCVFA